ncbi:recombination protein NinG [Hydrogenophaga sp.]|uniref:recombination protein NinG n=1 Tax=Hydrogenophaga sp. TaxID=1904254 RepID=UPI0035AF458A
MKACKVCETPFSPARPLQVVCGPKCALAVAKDHRKAEKENIRKRKAAVKTNGQKKAEAQRAVNAFVRARDANLACISCGRMHEGAWHAGHFRSRGSAPHLALDPRNIHRQCAPCNLFLHGNLIGFRAGLISRYGEDFVKELEADHYPRHYSGHDYEEIKREYRAKLKEIESGKKED